jgi:hypothetical protein
MLQSTCLQEGLNDSIDCIFMQLEKVFALLLISNTVPVW